MATDHTTSHRQPLRVWPGVAIVALMMIAVYVVPLAVPEAEGSGILIALGASLLVLLWWLLFSRAPWIERLTVPVVLAAAVFALRPLVHESIAGGAMGILLFILAIPVMAVALVVWAGATRNLGAGARRAAFAATVVLASAGLMAIRTTGIRSGGFEMQWRWTKTPEERLLAQTRDDPPVPAAAPNEQPPGAPVESVDRNVQESPRQKLAPSGRADGTAPADAGQAPPPPGGRVDASHSPRPSAEATAAVTPARARVEWPGFRGPYRNSVVTGVRIETDWTASPPVELWRRPIGPGWSSFAVAGDRIYTQEQRGEDEIVACYDLNTGAPVWMHRESARFWESNGGPGPRATPTLSNGRVYALGATGIVNALDARDGRVIWSRNAASDAGKKIPQWGMAASPLVVDDLVIVAAAGRLIAYELATGAPRWLGPDRGMSYSSPHLATIGGVTQVLLQRSGGVTSVAPGDGTVLWEHAWDGGAIVQPAVTAEGDLLISTNGMNGGNGLRRIAAARAAGGWGTQERWTSRGLKPYFNDFVVHEGHAYGFDGRILSCIDLTDGERKWKGGRYGQGQLVLLAEQDLLLVLSEDGEAALVRAQPDQFTEVARFQAIEGKTWNHPVLAGDVLLVRNGEEMAAFRIARAAR